MNFKVVLSEQAEDDLADIYSYILNILQSKKNADSVLDRLCSAMNDLTFMAESYHLYPNEPWRSLGVHYFSVNNYSIFYAINKDKKNPVITVLHIVYGKRDLDKILASNS